MSVYVTYIAVIINYGWHAVRFMWHFGYLLFNFTGNIVINVISLLMRKIDDSYVTSIKWSYPSFIVHLEVNEREQIVSFVV
jgi:hypothetical protein